MQVALYYYGEWKHFFFFNFLDFSLESTLSRFKTKLMTLFRSMMKNLVL